MKVTLLLADAAQVANGKLYLLGGGWSVTGPDPTSFAIALKIDVPWDQANRRHDFKIQLLDADGHPVVPQIAGIAAPVEVAGQFEVGRPVGVTPGTPLDTLLAINLGPIPLPPARYVWRLSIDEEWREDWQVAFSVRNRSSA
jgi:hypothetical protein